MLSIQLEVLSQCALRYRQDLPLAALGRPQSTIAYASQVFVITVILAPDDGAKHPRGGPVGGSINASEHL
jgi:hypothetical protein